MKKVQYFISALAVAALLAIPAAAQKGEKGERNNNGTGKQLVQTENKKGDKDPTPSQGSKSRGQHKGWTKKGEHKDKGHS